MELKPQGKITVTVVKANNLKNMEMIGKSDPYVVLYIRPLFKVKTHVVDNNLNPVWNQAFELIAEDKETESIVFEVLTFKHFYFLCNSILFMLFAICGLFDGYVYMQACMLYLCIHIISGKLL